MNLLLGDISSYKAIASARFISSHYPEVTIIGFDSKNFTRKIHTKYATKVVICKDDSIDSILNVIQNESIDCFLPVINKSLSNFWLNKEKFGRTLDYLGTFDSYELLNDKDKLYELAKSMEIKVPQKFNSIEEAVVPYVVKPTNLSSAEGVIYVKDSGQVPKNSDYDNVIIQEYVEGEGVGFSFYCKDGIIVNGYGHKRLAEYPITGGSSTFREGYEDTRMVEVASAIVKKLDYSGFAMFEFKLTESDELYLLEVNPRIWGSINQGLMNGNNYFEEILGKVKIDVKGSRYRTYLGPHIYITLLLYLTRLNFQPLWEFLKSTGRNKGDVSLFFDPLGYLSTLLRKLLK